MSIYEYIPDKKMYAAVMGACSYIRATGWYNKAIDYYADKYSVDREELKGYVDRRTHAKKRKSGYKMKTFIVKIYTACDAYGDFQFVEEYEKKAKSKENLEERISELLWKRQMREDYGGSYAPYYTFEIVEKEK